MPEPLQPTPPLVFWSWEILGTRTPDEIEGIMHELLLHGVYLQPGASLDDALTAVGDDVVLLLFKDAAGRPWTGVASAEAVGAASRRRGVDALDGAASFFVAAWPDDPWPPPVEEGPL